LTKLEIDISNTKFNKTQEGSENIFPIQKKKKKRERERKKKKERERKIIFNY
jgi:hypothetical protein